MEELRWSCRLYDLNVVFRGVGEKAFQTCAGMLRTHSFESVRQQKRNAAQPAPFVFRSRNELVHDHLRGVPEVTELRLPSNESIGIIETVSILETEHRGFRQWTFIDLHVRLIRSQTLKRVIFPPILHIVQYRMTMTECSTFGVLARQPYRKPLGSKRSKCQ